MQPTRFDALAVALDLARSVRPLVERIAHHDRDLARQVRRAVSSVVLNVSEGNQRRGGDRRQLFACAHGSAAEIDGALRFAEAFGYLDRPAIEAALELVDRQRALLYRLRQR